MLVIVSVASPVSPATCANSVMEAQFLLGVSSAFRCLPSSKGELLLAGSNEFGVTLVLRSPLPLLGVSLGCCA